MEVVLFTGIQASGKTSFYQKEFFRTHVRVNLDMLHSRHREKTIVDALLKSHTKFVVDNTNPTKADRSRYITPAKEAKFKVIGYYFDCTINAAIWRNSWRYAEECIPEVGIRSCAKKLEIPEFEEGFDELYIVHLSDAKGFTVEPL